MTDDEERDPKVPFVVPCPDLDKVEPIMMFVISDEAATTLARCLAMLSDIVNDPRGCLVADDKEVHEMLKRDVNQLIKELKESSRTGKVATIKPS